MVFTTRHSQGKKGAGTRNGLETELRRLNVVQKNGRPNHPTTQGKVERFQQTMKKWLRAQPDQPTTLDHLQTLIDAFVTEYNHHRPHRSLDHRATPATVYTTRPKAAPSTGDRDDDGHDRVRHDKVDKAGKITWRYHGQSCPGLLQLSGSLGKPRVVEEIPHRTAPTVSERLGTVAHRF